MLHRVLFITYYFPPSGGPGVQRALKFVKYLPDYGWQPTVLTVHADHAAYPDLDPTMMAEVPLGIQVERTYAWDPYALYAGLLGQEKSETVGVSFTGEGEATWKQRLARWFRANVFLPDARAGWGPFAVHRAKRLLAQGPFDALLTTGPPHSTHRIGLRLARRYRLPWLADFRDPWTGIDYYDLLPMTGLARAWDARMERTVLETADVVTAVSPAMARALSDKGGRSCQVLMNGYDPEDFADVTAHPSSDVFDLTYVGNLNEDRNPDALWQALARLEAPDQMADLRVRLVGHIDPVVIQAAERRGLGDLLKQRRYVPHPEAIQTMKNAGVLLLVINRVPGAEGIMTGKLYEYLASGRPILGIGPVAGDAAAVLEATGAGRMFDFDDVAGVASFVHQHYVAWQMGYPKSGATARATAAYSRQGQAQVLAGLLEALAARREADVQIPIP